MASTSLVFIERPLCRSIALGPSSAMIGWAGSF